MALLPLTLIPDPILRQKAKPVELAVLGTKDFQGFCDDLIETMFKKDGIGLAAPQVGQSISVCVVTHVDGPLVMVNPRITKHSFRKQVMEEGCLSIPGVFGTVRRPKRVAVTYTDRHGKEQQVDAQGMLARVIQHEVDHLNGILFTDMVITYTHGERPAKT